MFGRLIQPKAIQNALKSVWQQGGTWGAHGTPHDRWREGNRWARKRRDYPPPPIHGFATAGRWKRYRASGTVLRLATFADVGRDTHTVAQWNVWWRQQQRSWMDSNDLKFSIARRPRRRAWSGWAPENSAVSAHITAKEIYDDISEVACDSVHGLSFKGTLPNWNCALYQHRSYYTDSSTDRAKR